jgi:hypothetical protein
MTVAPPSSGVAGVQHSEGTILDEQKDDLLSYFNYVLCGQVAGKIVCLPLSLRETQSTL